jgi:hypothetical protein
LLVKNVVASAAKGKDAILTLAAFSFTWLGGYLQERSKGIRSSTKWSWMSLAIVFSALLTGAFSLQPFMRSWKRKSFDPW